MSVLEKTASQLEAVLGQWHPRLLVMDGAQVHSKPSEDRWSISEVFGHLVDSAANNHQRFVRGQFVEALEFPKYDQNQWVAAAGYADFPWEDLVALWYYYNRLLAAVIRRMDKESLSTRCTIVPYEPCTLEHLVTDYLVHLQHHLEKIAERS